MLEQKVIGAKADARCVKFDILILLSVSYIVKIALGDQIKTIKVMRR